MRALVFGALTVGALTACAGTINHELQRETARAIQPTPNPDSVKLSDVHRPSFGHSERWVATTPEGVYDCSREVGEEHAICVKRP